MKKDNEKLNKIKELYNKYKEAKKDPRKKAGMKLLGYFIFFFIIALIANIASNIEQANTYNKTTTTTTTTKVIDSYVEKQKDLLIDKYKINYEIKFNNEVYSINGNIENNILNGYLENNNTIKKITIKNNMMYEIKDNEEIIFEVDFNINNLNLDDIINTIKQTSAFIKEKDNIKTYLYELDSKKIYINCNNEYIENIKIEEISNIYNLNFEK